MVMIIYSNPSLSHTGETAVGSDKEFGRDFAEPSEESDRHPAEDCKENGENHLQVSSKRLEF